MGSMILELQDDALDREVRVSDLLRKALVVARKLSLQEFQEWIEKELKGYPEGPENIPDYRMLYGKVRAWNPLRGWEPVFFENSEMGERLSQRKIAAPIAELEYLVDAK